MPTGRFRDRRGEHRLHASNQFLAEGGGAVGYDPRRRQGNSPDVGSGNGSQHGQFGSASRLAKWAGICPGNNESAGKHLSGKTPKGNIWLRRALCEAAWAASRTKDTYLAAQYKHFIVRKGKKKTIVAVAHSMLSIAYYLLTRQCPYAELGGDFFDRVNQEAVRSRLVKKLVSLGYQVTLTPVSSEAAA